MTDPTTKPTPDPIAEPASDPIAAKCEHILHPNGLHEFILREFGMTGADAFITQMERLYQGHTLKNPPLLLIGAWLFLKERIPLSAWLGILLISAGLVLVSGS